VFVAEARHKYAERTAITGWTGEEKVFFAVPQRFVSFLHIEVPIPAGLSYLDATRGIAFVSSLRRPQRST
jgi:hypothetical protein